LLKAVKSVHAQWRFLKQYLLCTTIRILTLLSLCKKGHDIIFSLSEGLKVLSIYWEVVHLLRLIQRWCIYWGSFMRVGHLLRPIYRGGPLTEAHLQRWCIYWDSFTEVVHLLRPIYEGGPFTEAYSWRWAIY